MDKSKKFHVAWDEQKDLKMGKQKKWRRVRLADLARADEQAKVLGVQDQGEEHLPADSPEKQPSESPQVE